MIYDKVKQILLDEGHEIDNEFMQEVSSFIENSDKEELLENLEIENLPSMKGYPMFTSDCDLFHLAVSKCMELSEEQVEDNQPPIKVGNMEGYGSTMDLNQSLTSMDLNLDLPPQPEVNLNFSEYEPFSMNGPISTDDIVTSNQPMNQIDISEVTPIQEIQPSDLYSTSLNESNQYNISDEELNNLTTNINSSVNQYNQNYNKHTDSETILQVDGINILDRSKLKVKETIKVYAYCANAEQRMTKTNKPYYTLTFKDKNGVNVVGRFFGALPIDYKQLIDTFLLVEGLYEDYKGNCYIKVDSLDTTISNLEQVKAEFSLSDTVDVKESTYRLFSYISNIKKKWLQKLTENLVKNNLELYISKPAGISYHDAQEGGLLQHTLANLDIAMILASRYHNTVDLDIIISAIVLHDIGKIFEMPTEDDKSSYTTIGRLQGHICIGFEMIITEILVSDLKSYPDFNVEDKLKLIHCILSHHGVKEHGSPVEPQILEASIVSNADMADSDTNHTYGMIRGLGKNEYVKEFGKSYTRL